MTRHNLTFIYRSFKKNKSWFFINWLGLSTGLVCALLIYLWVKSELGVDKFHENDARLFQVMKTNEYSNGVKTFEMTPGPLAEALTAEIPEIEYAVNVYSLQNGTIMLEDNSEIRAKEIFAGKDLFNVFSFNLIEGNEDQLLEKNDAVVISEELSLKIFNTTENVVGRTIDWNQADFSGTYLITGVFESTPENSTLQFDVVYSYDLFATKKPDQYSWGYNDPFTYIVLNSSSTLDGIDQKMTRLIREKSEDESSTLFLHLFSDKYLKGTFVNGVQSGGRITYVRLFSIIAIAILSIAWINFMNLSTAQASKRLKEVGIKKALGIRRGALVFQFLGESTVLTILSLFTALLFVFLFLPQFNLIVGKQLILQLNADLVLYTLVLLLLTGLISGSYPAFYLSGFNAVTLLKGKIVTKTGELWTRKALVVFQFLVSVLLIVSVIVIYYQIEFIQNKNLGYSRDNVIYFKKEGRIAQKLETFLLAMENIPGVVNATSFAHNLTGDHGKTSGLVWEGRSPEEQIAFSFINANYNFIELLDINVKKGRSFSRDFSTDDAKIIFNEMAIETMGLEDPIGKIVNLWGQDREIVGIVENFHFESLYEEIKPCFFKISDYGDHIMIRMEAGTTRQTISKIQKFFEEYNNGLPFDFKFIDEDYQALYESENRVAVLSKYFAVIAIVISCLGLFALAAFTSQKRLKEIGIRKTLGASEMSIVYLLSSSFTRTVSISLIIALPLSYFALREWLDQFIYRVDLELWYFILAGFMALLITWLTVGMQTIKASKVNPLSILKED
ncbi:MAG: ABC transporter permease [Bacteroidota bacterium]